MLLLQTMNINLVLQKLGISQLNAMQREALDVIGQSQQDVVLLSPTGSGKTLAYLLPLAQLLDVSDDAVQVLVVVPGRELALQSHRVLKDMGSGIRSAACYGGRTAMEEHRKLKEIRPQVVFGTPGRLCDHLDKENISPYTVRLVVIDEFDKCLEMGFHDEMSRLLGKLPGLRRRILLSATDADQIPDFVRLGSCVRMNYLSEDEQVPQRVSLYRVDCQQKDKLPTLRALLCQQGDVQSIVFLNYRDAVERVGDFLRREGFAVSVFHGGMEQKDREAALYRFSNGSATVLVCTDLASRGLDIPDVGSVIHYHLPVNDQEMIHRVGRTARWDKWGDTFFLVGPEETFPAFVDADVQAYPLNEAGVDAEPPQPRMATIYIGKGKKDKLSRGDIMGFLCKKGGLDRSEIGRIDVADRYAYAAVARTRLQQVLRQTAGEKIKGLRTVVEPVK